MNEAIADLSSTRSQRLKAATHLVHDLLDKRIMAADIFSSRAQFARFLRVQYRFHRDIDVLYANPMLADLFPQLAERRRLLKIANDLNDLGQLVPPPDRKQLDADIPLPAALGRLYVVEGSNLGGTILFKMAREKLGLHDDFGARHLAPHPEGAARHWRRFTVALDAAPVPPKHEHEVVRAAEAAFHTVLGYVQEELPLSDNDGDGAAS